MNHRRVRRGVNVWLVLILAVLAVPASRVDAQPIVDDVESIELMAADSTLIVRGTILAMKTVEKPPGYVWHTVAFNVSETIKGEHRAVREFLVLANTVEKDLQRWREQNRSLLVFLEESRYTVARWGRREYLRFPFAPRTGYPKGRSSTGPRGQVEGLLHGSATLTDPDLIRARDKDGDRDPVTR